MLDSLPPYDEVIVADGNKHGILARYRAAMKAKNDVIYFQDDDLILKDHHGLLGAWEDDGRFYANMIGPEWWEHQEYFDLALVGAGSLVPKELIPETLGRYLERWPNSPFFRRHCDFIFGVLAPFKRLELETELLDSASDENALWKKPDQMRGKWMAVKRARALRKIVLTMLTKNEEENIVRALTSAAPLVDSALIHDTGSTDKTIELALSTGDELGLPVRIKEVEWVNFGQNRAWLLAEARQYGDYQLLMDADEEFIDHPDSWPELSLDAYELHYAGEVDWGQPRLIRSAMEWFWADDIHSYLASYEPRRTEHLRKPLFVHHGDERGFTKERLLRDCKKIIALLKVDPTSSRSVFNLAKALEGLGREEEAIELYRLRTDMGDSPEEAFWSRYRLGCLLTPKYPEEGMETLLQAWRERPWRIEPLRALSKYATDIADRAPYPEEESLFVLRSDYQKEG